MSNAKVVKAGTAIKTWTCVSIVSGNFVSMPTEKISSSMREMIGFWRGMGINFSIETKGEENPKVVQIEIPRGQSGEQEINSAFTDLPANTQFVFVVLPDRSTKTYNIVKTLADTQYGFHTICVQAGNLTKGRNPGYFANVGLKVNLKAGGTNHILEQGVTLINEDKTMVVGYDVTHPTNLAGKMDNLPSLVGMVSSIDKDLAQWPAIAWAQAGRVEMLDETLGKKFGQRISLWQEKHNKQLPENIVIFRDGVSEGQFLQVLDKELTQMRKACDAMYTGQKKPKFTLIVSVKRHQTRFFPTDPGNMTKSRNIKNGTVVDRGVTLTTIWDYFLTAHTALQGMSSRTNVNLRDILTHIMMKALRVQHITRCWLTRSSAASTRRRLQTILRR
jgi:eukaryotic translation initiation factor 2C